MASTVSSSRRRLVVASSAAVLLPVLFLAPVVYGYIDATEQRVDVGRDDSPMIGKPLPVFSLTTRGEKAVSEADFQQGRYIFNVFASWCSYCVHEHPVWMDIDKTVPGANIIGVAWSDRYDATGRWLKRHGNPYDMVLTDDRGALAVGLGVGGAPETYLIEDGIIVGYIEGVTDSRDKQGILLPFISGEHHETPADIIEAE